MAKSRKAEIGKKVGLGFLETVIHVCVYIIVIFVFIRAATLGFDFSYHVFGDPAMSKYNQNTVSFEVAEGSVTKDVASQLEDAGLIKYKTACVIKVKLSKLDNSLVPGTYELSPSMTSSQILAILTTPTEENSAGTGMQAGEDASGTITNESVSESETGESEAGEQQ